jgi:hypothetical protein
VVAPRVALTVPPPAAPVTRLVADAVASRLAAADPTLWPPGARLGWVRAPRASRPLVGEVAALRERLRVAGVSRVVLAAAGGTGLATEVLAAASPTPDRLVVLDTSDPVQVADALAGDLEATVLVVSAPPGADTATVELLRDTADRAFRAEGLDPAAHTVVVSAPGGPRRGATVVLGDPDVAGPWSALTAFGLVPAGLAGAEPGALLAGAATARDALAADDPANPALVLGALLATAGPVVALAGADTALAEWAAHLVGGATGARGPLPVVVEGPAAPGWDGADLTVGLGADPGDGAMVRTLGPPAAQVLLWQHAAAVAAHLLDVDPTAGSDAAAAPAPDAPPVFVDGAVAVHAGEWLPPGTATVADALHALVAALPADGSAHLAVHAYLDRIDDASAAVLRAELARRTGLTTTFGWAPRCVPGVGERAAVCQLTGDAPGDPEPLGALQRAQARADAAVLARRGRPVLRLHLTDRLAGLVTVARAVQDL